MIERLLITFIIGALLIGLYQLLLLYQRRRAGLAVSTGSTGNIIALPASPRLLYFHSEYCGACTAQAHYLEALEDHHRALIEPINIEQEPALARQFNVMTLPTTILINGQDQVRYINPGLANPFKLTRQLDAL